MHDPPTISVIVPAYNTEDFLPRCLDSLLAQGFSDFEVVLVDDGSTDRSFSVLESYVGRFAACTLISQENRGLSAARNAGVRVSRGRYLAFVDSDDWVAPTFLETLYRIATETGSDIAQVAYITSSHPVGQKQAAEGVRVKGLYQKSFDRESSCDISHETADQRLDSTGCAAGVTKGGHGCWGDKQVVYGDLRPSPHEQVRVLSSGEALIDMFETEEYTVCTRLYARWLFDGMGDDGAFPIGLTCEDRVANFKLVSRAHRIAVSNRVEYFYYLNLGSISYNGLDRRGFDLLAADALVLDGAKALGDATVLHWAEDRCAKGAYSLLVKWARFGITDPSLDEKEALFQLNVAFKRDYARLMASKLPFSKKAVAWQLRYTPGLLRAEFWLYNFLTGAGKPRKAASR